MSPSSGGRDRVQLHAPIGRNGGDAGGQAAGETGEDHFDGSHPVVLGREDLGMVGVDGERGAVRLLGAQAREVLDGRSRVGAVDPLAAGPPLELGGFGGGGEGLARGEECLHVHAVLDAGCFGVGHVVLLWLGPEGRDRVSAPARCWARG